jgi:thiol-disulfide isomerase/thioredoxin
MLKKSLVTASLTTLFALVLFMVYTIVEKVHAKKAVQNKIQTLSVAQLFKMDSTQFQLALPRPVLLVYFNSECEHCQYELIELKTNLSAFNGISILLMSSENMATIKEAAQKFELAAAPNAEFVKINREDVFEHFGSLSVPHLFLYGADSKLIKEFKGETKIEAILQYLPK